ncbi:MULTISPECIES: ATP cone domain-containing protein [Methanobacterium]|jgi:transcriptional repressor NrdR|uniref:ATP cone domain-containing protein n=1 Tax=Methanobacterium veterum TaxID=408577 RepID=A0A9E5A4E5_9EURY|nr:MULTISPECIES: ATP cone domain-containing protein [Methanobacterium]MCZ3365244.1 ATP cone domain-containing protein [Methanobacterium veterum]MCZ3372999.1 ATP cone domain-containing protein [Methanobacterium veterum]
MTDVIKSNGKREQFSKQKVKNAVENAVKDAGFSPQEKMNVIEHASQDAAQMAQGKDEIQTRQIRDTVLNDLEQDDQQVANAWKQYERQHGINY